MIEMYLECPDRFFVARRWEDSPEQQTSDRAEMGNSYRSLIEDNKAPLETVLSAGTQFDLLWGMFPLLKMAMETEYHPAPILRKRWAFDVMSFLLEKLEVKPLPDTHKVYFEGRILNHFVRLVAPEVSLDQMCFHYTIGLEGSGTFFF